MPRDKMGWHKIKVFPKSMMAKLAVNHIPFMQNRVQKLSMDYKGHTFKPYDPSYVEYKASRFKSKRTGKRIPSMAGKSIKSTRMHPPDLTVTGMMLKNLQRKRYDHKSYVIGWTGEEADKVEYNKNMGRNIIDDVPNREKKFLVKLLEKDMMKQFRTKLKDVNITIGS